MSRNAQKLLEERVSPEVLEDMAQKYAAMYVLATVANEYAEYCDDLLHKHHLVFPELQRTWRNLSKAYNEYEIAFRLRINKDGREMLWLDIDAVKNLLEIYTLRDGKQVEKWNYELRWAAADAVLKNEVGKREVLEMKLAKAEKEIAALRSENEAMAKELRQLKPQPKPQPKPKERHKPEKSFQERLKELKNQK